MNELDIGVTALPDGLGVDIGGRLFEMNVETGKIIHVDSRGYCLVAKSGGTYRAGCHRNLSREQALAHWGGPGYQDLERGAGFVAAIERGEEIAELPEELEWLNLDGGTLPAGTVMPDLVTPYR